MKKLVIFSVVCFLINMKSISAVVVRWDFISDVYSNRYLNGQNYSGPIGYAYLENKLVYCMNPYIGSGIDYKRDDSILSRFTKEDLDYLSMVASFGEKEKELHPYYYLASQELIWRRITNGNEVSFTSEYKEKGDKIDISSYKNIIEDSVKRELEGPKFKTELIEANVFSTVVLIDENSVLDNYQVVNSSNHKVTIDGKTLMIEILDDTEAEIELIRKVEGDRMGFTSPNGQDLAYLSGFEKSIKVKIKPSNSYTERIRVHHNYQNKSIFSYFEFQIFDKQNQTYIEINGDKIFKTSNDGTFLSDFTLPRGKYEIIDVKAVDPYLKGSKSVFEINQIHRDGILDVNLEVDTPKATVTVKRYQNLFQKNKYPVSNVCYFLYSSEEIYGPDGEWLYPIGAMMGFDCTDHDGKIIFNNVPMGEFSVVEDFDPTNQNYIHDKQILPVSIQYKDDSTRIIEKTVSKIVDYLPYDINIWSWKEQFLGIIQQSGVYEMFPSSSDYGLYASNVLLFNEPLWNTDDLITTISVNEDGFRQVQIPLPKGDYYIMPILGGQKLYFHINEERSIDVEFYHSLLKGDITIQVLNEDYLPVESQQFSLTNSSNISWKGVTNQQGIIQLTNMPLGYYQVFDKETEETMDFYLPVNGKVLKFIRKNKLKPIDDSPITDDDKNIELIESNPENSLDPSFQENQFDKILPKTTKVDSRSFDLLLFGGVLLVYFIARHL